MNIDRVTGREATIYTPPEDIITIDGRYTCPVCGTRTETLGEKKRHMREAHPRKGGR